VQGDRSLPDKNKIVVDATAPDESALIAANQCRHPRRQAQRKELRHELRKGVHKADGPEVLQVDGTLFLGQERDQSSIKAPKI
jgi:hypothetical protein